jgi:hypothetical protein
MKLSSLRLLLVAAILSLPALSRADGEVLVPSGAYTIVMPSPGKITSGQGWIKFEWASVSPNPSPGPGPTPGPTPPPIPPLPPPVPKVETRQVWVLAIYEYDQLATIPATQADIRSSASIAQSMKELDAIWKTVDKDEPLASAWLQKLALDRPAAPIPLPAFLVLAKDSAGKPDLISASPLPLDEAGVVKAIKQLRGKE